jgi:hypothetical protein
MRGTLCRGRGGRGAGAYGSRSFADVGRVGLQYEVHNETQGGKGWTYRLRQVCVRVIIRGKLTCAWNGLHIHGITEGGHKVLNICRVPIMGMFELVAH